MVDGGSPERSADVLKLGEESHGQRESPHALQHALALGSDRLQSRARHGRHAHHCAREHEALARHRCRLEVAEARVQAAAEEALPNQTFYTTDTLDLRRRADRIRPSAQAHTDGDIYVFFRNANVLVAGDVVSVGAYPIIDYCTNGWIGGMAERHADAARPLQRRDTKIVPGLGPVQSRADLQARERDARGDEAASPKLLAQGMSAQDMIDAAPDARIRCEVGRSEAASSRMRGRGSCAGARAGRLDRLTSPQRTTDRGFR